jgi:hypothetical protein
MGNLNKMLTIKISEDELHMIRQWFSSVQDTNPAFLEQRDYKLAYNIYERLGWRVPNSIAEKA